MIRIKKSIFRNGLFMAAILVAISSMAVPASGETELSSVEKLYASLAKLPADKLDQTLAEGARKEGTILVYGATEEKQMHAVMDAFKKRYPGVKIEYLRSTADVTLSKALMEVRSQKWMWDVLSMGGGYNDLKKANALAKHFGLLGPGFLKEGMGEDWSGNQFLPLVIAYNTDLVKPAEAPKGYQEMLDPKWKGKISIDTYPENLVAGMIKKWGKEKAENWLDKFVNDNQALLRKGHTTQTKLLIAGEFPVACEVYAYRVESERKEKGAPIDWLIPNDVFEVEIPADCLSRHAPNPYGALLWQRFRISAEGQSVYAQFGRIPINPKATVKYKRLQQIIEYASKGGAAIIGPQDAKLFTQAGELIEKIIAPRIRGK